ncbi:spermidine synthase [Wenjunlia vitaminophila]|uniref:Spermidine synthase n=1 Tax=Wenjunlia vitaminophila TaxID=76728 RepID=A0A0T6LRD1_WENVI|nr:spermidine synthase [Wenjunlia vitaminophila]KRV48675.1 spermidine synthase [Wenjunlia vitaminophila]
MSFAGTHDQSSCVTVDRRTGPDGEVVLRRRGERYEIIANGCFLMDTSDGRSERLLVNAALDALLPSVARPSVLIGGLGVGFSLAEAVAEPRWGRIVIVEREPAVIDWHRTGELAQFTKEAWDDPRTQLVQADLVHHITTCQDRHHALCLDIDNGPDWTVTEANAGLYDDAGLATLRARLHPGGVLAVWGAQHSAAFEERLRGHFTDVRTLRVPVPRGEPDVIHLAHRNA